jgi:hypothetical protein
MSTAKDEFDALIKDNDRSNKHPEDEASRSDDEHTRDPEHFYEKDDEGPDDDDDDDLLNDHSTKSDMRSRYFLPSLQSNANTGPKGVIADAQAFEQAKKSRRLSFIRGRNAPAALHPAYPATKDVFPSEEKSSDDDNNEEGFMARWRLNRLRELQEAGRRMTSRSRTVSPSKRVYGNLPTVDGDGFLDAIEKVHSETVVVVFIYDDLVSFSPRLLLVPPLFHQPTRTHPCPPINAGLRNPSLT